MRNFGVLVGIMLLTSVHAFDELVLVIALPEIAQEFDAQRWYGLTMTSYILASILGMTWSGQRIDRRGPSGVFLIGIASFSLGLLLAVVSNNIETFITARLLQGFGGGIGWTLAFALINLMFEPQAKAKAVAALDVAWVVPSVLAPAIGGYLVDHLHWHWIFAIQLIPLTVVGLLLGPKLTGVRRRNEKLSWDPTVNGLRIALGLGGFFYLASTKLSPAWLLLIPAVWIALPAYNAHMPAQWWRASTMLSLAVGITLPAFVVFYSMEAFMPLYLITERELSTVTTGWALTIASVAWMTGSVVQAKFQDKLSARRAMRLGFGMLAGSLGIQAVIIYFHSIPIYWSYPVWLITGFGMGLAFNAARSTALHHTPQKQEGGIATAISLTANLGIGIATGVGGAITNQVEYYEGGIKAAMLLLTLLGMGVAIGVQASIKSRERRLP